MAQSSTQIDFVLVRNRLDKLKSCAPAFVLNMTCFLRIAFGVLVTSCVSGSIIFRKLSNTPPEYTCTIHARNQNEHTIVALFLQGPSKSLQVHSFKKHLNELGVNSALDKLISRFCPLTSDEKLNDDTDQIFDRDYKRSCGEKMLKLAEEFYAYYNYEYHLQPLANNTLKQEFAIRPREICEYANFSKILVHSEALELIRMVASSKRMRLKSYIQHLFVDRAVVFSKDGKIPRKNTSIPHDHDFTIDVMSKYLNCSEMILSTFLMVSTFMKVKGNCDGASDPCLRQVYIITVPEIANLDFENLFKDPFFIVSQAKQLKMGNIGNFFLQFIFKSFPYLNFAEIQAMNEDERIKRYIKYNGSYFDTFAYKRVLEWTIVPFLINANNIAESKSKNAILYVADWMGIRNIIIKSKDTKLDDEKLKEYIKTGRALMTHAP